MADWLTYSNRGTRNQPLNPKLINALGFLGDMGVTMDVFSGGQPGSGPNRVGSHRHDYGNAADVFFSKDGQRLNWANKADRPVFEEIVRRSKAAGVTGFGAGQGYMQPGSMHIGYGTPAVWGAGGSGANAPAWLRQAAGGNAPNAGTTPGVPPMQPADQGQAYTDQSGSGGPSTWMQSFTGQGGGDWMDNRSYSADALLGDFLAGHNPLRRLVYQKIMGLFS